jgi:DNA repair exonuclease SbcCD ATPase subunit
MESIARDEAHILTLQNNIRTARERQAQLPQLLASFKQQLEHLRSHKTRTATESKVERLKKLREEMAALLAEMK